MSSDSKTGYTLMRFVSQPVGEIHGLAVDEDQVDLRVGHPEVLDDRLHRAARREHRGKGALAALLRQEVVQLLVESDGH